MSEYRVTERLLKSEVLGVVGVFICVLRSFFTRTIPLHQHSVRFMNFR